jgi:hypothetical protein
MERMEARRRIRALGAIESTMALAHAFVRGNSEIVIGLALSCDGALDLAALKMARAVLHRRFALLRCVIEDDGKRQYFCDVAAESAIEVAWRDRIDGELQDFVRQALDEPALEPTRGLWRLSAAPAKAPGQHFLALVLHHAIADAYAAGYIVGTLLTSLDRGLSGLPCEMRRGECVPPPLDDFLRAAPDDATVAALQAPASQPDGGWQPLAQRHTGFLTFELNAPAHAAFRKACRFHDVSENSVLTALYAKACVASGAAPPQILVKSAVSLREFLGASIDADALGCYIGVTATELDTELGTVPELAARYHRQLIKAVLGSAMRKPRFTLQGLRNYMLTAEEASTFQAGIGITNIGGIAVPSGLRRVRMTGYLPVARRLAVTNQCVLHVHELGQGLGLGLTLVYPAPNFPQSKASAILAALGEGFARFARHQPEPVPA